MSFAGAAFLHLTSAGVAAGAEPPEVAPGTAVRWPADGLEHCGRDDLRWRPVGEACWYPIDLLVGEGTLDLLRWRDGQRESIRVRVAAYPYEVQHIELEDDSRVNLSGADLRRVERERPRISGALRGTGEARFTLPLGPPLDPLPTGGRFGARRFFNGQPRSPHTGADYAAPEGEPVLAAADGVVRLADDFFFSGRSLFLDHGDSLITMYFHLSAIDVEEGATVRRGQQIGRVGATGRATGPHLHFGVRWKGARVDPAPLLAASEAPTLP